jgi:hypothetical protein
MAGVAAPAHSQGVVAWIDLISVVCSWLMVPTGLPSTGTSNGSRRSSIRTQSPDSP